MTQSYAIGIDVGGTALKCGLVDANGKITYSFLMPTNDVFTEGEVIALINAAIRKCVNHAKGEIIGVGVGFPGIVENGIILGAADNLPGFINFNLRKSINSSTGLNVVVDNDANMMAWGETKYGAGLGCSDVVFLTVGTGIGGSLVINNQLYGGFKNRGTEIGHIIINHDGIKCNCGSIGCLEAYASVTSLVENYAQLTHQNPHDLNGEIIIKKYLANQQEAVQAMQDHFDYLASGVTSLINIFSPQKVIIGGGISASGSFYIEEIKKRVYKRVMKDTVSNTEIVAAALENNAGLLGCAGLVFQKLTHLTQLQKHET
ncbi:ROK family protein [Pedobacter arcticus]|uniref:ROK family protein n=1 Tax=Pedobacter arcticus TaxID=752140 RepID=UPI0002ED969C|nr:ROK family protein [Pedobacter arcticus]